MNTQRPMFSIIIPVYNRPQEVQELLESLVCQSVKDFEVVIVEDGSTIKCDAVVAQFQQRAESVQLAESVQCAESGKLPIRYCYKENGGPAAARNYGAQMAQGEWLVFFDSDCIIPENYIAEAIAELQGQECELFGGADRSHPSFTPLQKAIDYSMTSILTTGGIRGNKKSADKFYPRTFNMGIQKRVFEQIGGFSNMRFGEDVDFSYKVKEGGYNSRFFPQAWVYHKRRNTFRTFFKQVFNSGIARIHLTKRHPGSLKLVHLLPSCFVLGCVMLVLLSALFTPYFMAPVVFLALLLFADATFRRRSLKTGALSVAASFVQLFGYGSGLLCGWWNVVVLGKQNYAAFVKNFYR